MEDFFGLRLRASKAINGQTVRGIPNDQSILVLVDFEEKEVVQRPDFYILTVSDWKELTNRKLDDGIEKNPDGWKGAYVNDENALVFPHQLNKSGKPYVGLGVNVKDVTGFQESWDKLLGVLQEDRLRESPPEGRGCEGHSSGDQTSDIKDQSNDG